MFVAWTTVAHREEAERIAADAIARHLSVCVQIDGPIVSHYRWQGRNERGEEYRLAFKCLESQLAALERHVLASHPYEVPEWLVIRAHMVGEKYLSWAGANSTNPPL